MECNFKSFHGFSEFAYAPVGFMGDYWCYDKPIFLVNYYNGLVCEVLCHLVEHEGILSRYAPINQYKIENNFYHRKESDVNIHNLIIY